MDRVENLLTQLVGGPKPFHPTSNFRISANGAFQTVASLMQLLATDGERVQDHILDSLIALFSQSTRNITHCRDFQVVSLLVELIPSIQNANSLAKAFVLLETLAKFSISVADVKALAALLVSDTLSDEHKLLVLRLLQNISARKAPKCFFDFDGVASGLALPAVEKWPSSAYSISVWFCIESFDDPVGASAEHYAPRLFSFLSERGNGLEAFFLRRRLHLRSHEAERLPVDFTFEPRRWYHLAITHQCSKMEWLAPMSSLINVNSYVKVYVDGRLVSDQGTLKYPNSSQPLVRCSVGRSEKFDSAFVKVYPSYFYGQTGMFAMFKEALTRDHVMELYEQGCDYVPTFQDTDWLAKPGMPKLVMAYHPETSESGQRPSCPNLALMQQQQEKTVLFGTMKDAPLAAQCEVVGTTLVTAVQTARDSVYCLAGAQLLLPYFRYLASRVQQNPQRAASVTPLLNTGLQLLNDLVSDARHALVQSMTECDGFRMLAQLLQALYNSVDEQTVMAIDKLVTSSRAYGDARLVKDAHALLLDFDTWIRCPFSVQQQLCNVLIAHIQRNSQFFGADVTVQRFLDLLQDYYYVAAAPQVSAAGRAAAQRTLKQVEVKAVRGMLLFALECLLSDSADLDDVQSMVYFLEECNDSLQQCDVLACMFNLLGKSVKNLVAHLDTLEAHRILFGLMSKDNEPVTRMSLKVLGRYVQQSSKQRKFFSENAASFSPELIPFSLGVYCVIVEVLVDSFAPLTDNPPAASRLVTGEVKRFGNPQLLGPLFGLLLQAPEDLQLLVLKEMHTCLDKHAYLCSHFLEQDGWQHWLLAFLEARRYSRNHEHGSDPVTGVVGQLLHQILHYAFAVKDGWKSVEETEAAVDLFANRARQADVMCQLQAAIDAQSSPLLDAAIAAAAPFESELKANPALADLRADATALAQYLSEPREKSDSPQQKQRYKPSSQQGRLDGEHLMRRTYMNLLAFSLKNMPNIQKQKPGPVHKNVGGLLALVNEFVFADEQHRDEARPHGVPWLDWRLVGLSLDIYDAAASAKPPGQERLFEVELSSSRGHDVYTIALHQSLVMFHEAALHISDVAELRKLLSRSLQRVKYILGQTGVISALQHQLATATSVPLQAATLAQSGSSFGTADATQKLLYMLFYLFKPIHRYARDKTECCQEIVVPWIREVFVRFGDDMRKLTKENYFDIPHQLLRENADKDLLAYFVDCMNSSRPQWNSFNFELKKIKSRVEEYMKPNVSLVRSRRQKGVAAIRSRMVETLKAEESAHKELSAGCFRLRLRHMTDEVHRRQTAAAARQELVKATRHAWKRLWRQLVNDRSPWYSLRNLSHDPFDRRSMEELVPEDTSKLPDGTFWKLDPTENAMRMHLKIKRNYSGSQHKSASLANRPQNLGSPRAAAGRPTQQEIDENLLLALSDKLVPQKPEDMELKLEDFEDNEVAEDWMMLDPEKSTQDTANVQELITFATACEMINLKGVIKGRLLVTANGLHFLVDLNSLDPKKPSTLSAKNYHWPTGSVVSVQKRRYLLRRNAIEIFAADRRNYLFNIVGKGHMKKLLKALETPFPGSCVEQLKLTPSDLLKSSGKTQQWQRREISNFEYLMYLNTIAGRSVNDLTQYPVFPWVLTDYESPSLDLADAKVYRDLSLPVGALNPKRLEQLLARYEAMDDGERPRFLYGSHYSSLGVVLYFMLRVEPYSTHFLENLQSGRWDVADRLFYSLASTWRNCTSSPSDVKELIPEFFYLPEMFRNDNNFDLGTKQDGLKVDAVVLPPWASSPEEFVRIHREALESEHVSANLHKWIDLIFGFKQNGPAAVKANNVFFYLTYEGSVNLDQIADPVERAAIEAQIANFGQTPSQLLQVPHEPRDAVPAVRNIFAASPLDVTAYVVGQLPFTAAYLTCSSSSDVVACSSGCKVAVRRWNGPPTQQQLEQQQFEAFAAASQLELLASDDLIVPPFAVAFPTWVACCHRWDNSIRVVENGRVAQVVPQHIDRITSLALTDDASMLVSTSKDGTACVWECSRKKSAKARLSRPPRHILRAHDAEVTCCAVSLDLDAVVTGSRDGTLVVHTLRTGRYVRTLRHPSKCGFSKVALSSLGDIVAYSHADNSLHVFHVNGHKAQYSHPAEDTLCDIAISRDSRFVVTAGQRLTVRRLSGLQLVAVHPTTVASSRIVAMTVARDQQSMFVALSNGKLVAFAQKAP